MTREELLEARLNLLSQLVWKALLIIRSELPARARYELDDVWRGVDKAVDELNVIHQAQAQEGGQ